MLILHRLTDLARRTRCATLGALAGLGLVVPAISSAQTITAETLTPHTSTVDAAVVNSVTGRVDIFGRSPSQTLQHWWGPSNGSVSSLSFEDLGGVLTSEPSAASWGAGHVAVFMRGSNGELWYLQWDNGSATGWLSLGGAITWNPDVVSRGPGHLVVFARWTDRTIRYREYSGGAWGPWVNLSGVATADPMAVSTDPGHMGVCKRGQADDLWCRHWTSSAGWGAWQGFGGKLYNDPVLVSRAPGVVDAFVKGGNSEIWRVAVLGGNGAWTSLGGNFSSEPAAVVVNGRMEVFATGQSAQCFWSWNYATQRYDWICAPVNGNLFKNVSLDGGASWGGWQSLGQGTVSGNPEASPNVHGGWNLVMPGTKYFKMLP